MPNQPFRMRDRLGQHVHTQREQITKYVLTAGHHLGTEVPGELGPAERSHRTPPITGQTLARDELMNW